MSNLAAFIPDVDESKTITSTKKGGKRKLGGSLATTVKGEVATLPNSDSIQVIEFIERKYGAGFVHDMYAALQKESESQGEVFNNTLAVEEIITLSRVRNVENAKKLARERMDVAVKLEQLLKLKKEAESWMVENNFEKMVDFWHLQRCKPSEIVARMKKDAATLHLELIDFQITPEGFDIPEYKFVHEDKIEACKNRLLELGADLAKLKEMGIEL